MTHWYKLSHEERVRLMRPTIYHRIYGIIGTTVQMISKIIGLVTLDKLRLWLGENQP